MFSRSYSYSDICIIPRELSTACSRDLIKTDTYIDNYRLNLPILVAPMDDVVGPEMANAAWENHILACLPRSLTRIADATQLKHSIPSLSAHECSSYRTVEKYISKGLIALCIDTANGFSSSTSEAIRVIRKVAGDSIRIIAGNIASAEGYRYLADQGVYAVRVGIANGGACTTGVRTGISRGQASTIREINKEYREGYPLIIADGGVRETDDIIKALALGAHLVMCGSAFARCKESAGKRVRIKGKKYIELSGQASSKIKGNSKYVEGTTILVPERGDLSGFLRQIREGLTSAMSYTNCFHLYEFIGLGDENFEIMSNNAQHDRMPLNRKKEENL